VPLSHSKHWAWAEKLSTVKLVGVCSSVCLSETWDFATFQDIIHSVGSASGQHLNVFVSRKFVFYWLELALAIRFSFPKSWIQPTRSLKIWISANRIISVHRKGYLICKCSKIWASSRDSILTVGVTWLQSLGAPLKLESLQQNFN